MDLALIAQFWGIALLLTLTPGADWAYTIAAGVRAPSIAPSILGILFGYCLVILAVAYGVGALVTQYPVLLTVLTLGGSAYLMWLGVGALRSRSAGLAESERELGTGPFARFAVGTGVSGLNPKGFLLLLALLPQFITPNGFGASSQMLALGGIHLFNTAVVYTIVALLARRLLKSRPAAANFVARSSGFIMIVLGGILLAEQIAVLLR